MMLRNHGTLVMAKSLPQAFLTQWLPQRACEIQVATGAAGTPVDIPPDVLAVPQRALSGVHLPTGPGVPDSEARVRRVERFAHSWRASGGGSRAGERDGCGKG